MRRRLAALLFAVVLLPVGTAHAAPTDVATMQFYSSILSFGYQSPYCTSGTGPGAPMWPLASNSSVFCRVNGGSTTIVVKGLFGGAVVDATYIVWGQPGPLGYRSGNWEADSLTLSQEFGIFTGYGPPTLYVDMAITNLGGVAFVQAVLYEPSWGSQYKFVGNGVVEPYVDVYTPAVSGGEISAAGALTGL